MNRYWAIAAEASGRAQALEQRQGAAAEPAAQLEQRRRRSRKPLLDGDRADRVVDGVEPIVVGEVVDPEAGDAAARTGRPHRSPRRAGTRDSRAPPSPPGHRQASTPARTASARPERLRDRGRARAPATCTASRARRASPRVRLGRPGTAASSRAGRERPARSSFARSTISSDVPGLAGRQIKTDLAHHLQHQPIGEFVVQEVRPDERDVEDWQQRRRKHGSEEFRLRSGLGVSDLADGVHARITRHRQAPAPSSSPRVPARRSRFTSAMDSTRRRS